MKKNADYAIALKVRKVKPGEIIDESCSKFFGKPCLPESIKDPYPDDGVFFAQINCEELKDLDPVLIYQVKSSRKDIYISS